MAQAQQNQIMTQQLKKVIADRAEKSALGNSKTKLVNVASDICHDLKSKTSINHICNATYLSRVTVTRLLDMNDSESGRPYMPNADTIERVFIAAGYGVNLEPIKIKAQFSNKEKKEY
jgi:hypothetical protein